jgi:hypothetical protein
MRLIATDIAKNAVAGAALVLGLAAPAMAQDVDLQCRIVSAAPRVEVSAPTRGEPASPIYWNCNSANMPYIPPRWLCVTDASAQIYPPLGGMPYVRFTHDIPDHDYHQAPMNKPITTPIAFPANDPTLITLVNPTGQRVWALVRIAGYLGREAGVERSEACR